MENSQVGRNERCAVPAGDIITREDAGTASLRSLLPAYSSGPFGLSYLPSPVHVLLGASHPSCHVSLGTEEPRPSAIHGLEEFKTSQQFEIVVVQ